VTEASPITAISALTPAADKLPYYTGAAAASTTDFSAFARTLLDDADAAAMRVTLGISALGATGDAELDAIAGLTSAADRLPYFTGSGTASLATFTAAGRALVDDAAASDQRTTLGLAIGTDVQAYDAELAALAGLTSAADKVPYFTGSGTAAVATFTAAGRALVDDANAAAQLTTLGAAPLDSPSFTTVVHLPSTQLDNNDVLEVKTLQFNSVIDDGNTSTADTIDFSTGQYHKSTMTGNCTFTYTAPAGPCVLQHEIYQDGTGSRVMTLPATVKWPANYSASDKLLSTAINSRDLLILRWNGTDYVANLMKGVA
ncbi:MAG: hypothetical protein RL409_925, partial [Gemmatimonadota bacterium]